MATIGLNSLWKDIPIDIGMTGHTYIHASRHACRSVGVRALVRACVRACVWAGTTLHFATC